MIFQEFRFGILLGGNNCSKENFCRRKPLTIENFISPLNKYGMNSCYNLFYTTLYR